MSCLVDGRAGLPDLLCPCGLGRTSSWSKFNHGITTNVGAGLGRIDVPKLKGSDNYITLSIKTWDALTRRGGVVIRAFQG